MNLPFFQTNNQDLSLMQSRWSGILNPLLANPSIQSIILPQVSLKAGINRVNHKLGRKLVGWRVIRLRSNAAIYDEQDDNQTPDLTLVLVANTPVIIDLEVM